MNDEARLLFALWESVSEVIPVGERQEAAASMIRTLIDHGDNDFNLLHDAEGEDPYLDRALAEVAAEIAEDDEDHDDNYNREDD